MFTFQFAFSLPPTELHLSPSRRPLRLPVQAVTTKHHNLVFHKQCVSHGSAGQWSERGPTAGLQPGHFPASSHGAKPASPRACDKGTHPEHEGTPSDLISSQHRHRGGPAPPCDIGGSHMPSMAAFCSHVPAN